MLQMLIIYCYLYYLLSLVCPPKVQPTLTTSSQLPKKKTERENSCLNMMKQRQVATVDYCLLEFREFKSGS